MWKAFGRVTGNAYKRVKLRGKTRSGVMGKSTGAAQFRRLLNERVSGAVRPGVEALLLAAVALGCAQAGWTFLAPANAGASTAASTGDTDDHHIEVAEIRSPFAPDASGAASHAVAAMLSSVELLGVRSSTDPMRSGAMFTLADGAQRAFLVGQEVVDGVVLSDVEANFVILSYDGGEHRLDMSAPPTFSFARAMMGQQSAPATTPVAADVSAASPDQIALGESERAWLASTLANVERRNGEAYGWRIAGSLPQAVTDAGLAEGDLVLAVNGAGPGDLGVIAAAARSNAVSLEIERGGVRRTIRLTSGQPA